MGTQIHWIGVLVTAVAGFAVGGIWYGPLFGKSWMAARGLTDADKNSANMGLIFGTTFALNLISALVLDHVLSTYGHPSFDLALMIAGGIALGFIIPAMGVNYLFSRLSLRLFAIDAGYWLVIYCVMGTALHALS